jgi:peroxiredoxin
MALAEGKDQKKLKEAETQIANALAANPDFVTAYFNRGVLYLQQSRDAEGIAELKNFMQRAPKHDQVTQARKLIENPRRAREPFAPDFSFTTAQGEYVDSEDLRGKIVLLDFWGTWCPPCVESVPGLRNIHKRLDPERVVMIAISSDADEDKWRSFIEKEKMIWPQFLDRDRKVHSAFRVNVFPTYVLIDQDGVIRYRTIGGGWYKNAYLEDKIKDLLKKSAAARAGKL